MDRTSSVPMSVLRLRVDKGQGLQSGILFYTSLVHGCYHSNSTFFVQVCYSLTMETLGLYRRSDCLTPILSPSSNSNKQIFLIQKKRISYSEKKCPQGGIQTRDPDHSRHQRTDALDRSAFENNTHCYYSME